MKMKYYLTSLFLCMMFLGFSQSKNFIDQPYIESRITKDTLISPDRIELRLVLDENDTKNKESVEALEKKMFSQLKQMDLDIETQVSLSDSDSNFKFYALKKTGVLKSKHYVVELHSASQIGELMQRMESVGISNISILSVKVSNEEEIKERLVRNAVNKAIRQADNALAVNDQKAGNILQLYIEADTYNYQPAREARASTMQMNVTSDNTSEPQISFKKIRLSKTINIKLAIE